MHAARAGCSLLRRCGASKTASCNGLLSVLSARRSFDTSTSSTTTSSSTPPTTASAPAQAQRPYSLLNEIKENIYTIPNLLSLARLVASPVIGYLVVAQRYTPALVLFSAAAVTDLLDGFIARHYNMHSVLGTIIDPAADKTLMTTLTISLAYSGLLPVPLAVLIVGRDMGLVLASFIIRYRTLPPPKTLSRYFDFSLPSAEVHPTNISKANTALQLLLIGCTLASPVIPLPVSLLSWQVVLPGLHLIIATTTVWSGLSYLIYKDAVKIYKQPTNNNRELN